MTNSRYIAWGVGAFALLILLFNTLYVVDQKHTAVVLRFGQYIGQVNMNGNDAGLKVKVPFLDNVVILDRRNLYLESDEEEVIAADQERLVVDAYVRYRISDPGRYYVTLNNETRAEAALTRLVNSSLRQVLGAATSNEIISGRRAALMAATRLDVDRRARAAGLGIEILDVRIKRADLPGQNTESVFNRMKSVLAQQATQTRSQGEQQKREIVANADREVTVTLATARQEAMKVRGEGDARRVAIFAEAYGRDPSFAAFWRSMQAYDEALANGQTTFVLSPDSAFFRYFERGPSG